MRSPGRLRVMGGVGCGWRIAAAIAVVWVGVVSGQQAWAQNGAPNAPGQNVITRERLEAAKALMIAMGMKRRFEIIIQTIGQRLGDSMARRHPAAATEIRRVYASVTKDFLNRSNDAIGLIAPLYAEKFTVAELDTARTFYGSPLGRKLLAAQMDIAKRSQNLGAVWGGRVGRQMQQAVLAELQKLGISLAQPAGR